MSQPNISLNEDAVEDLEDSSFITPPNKGGVEKPLTEITAVNDQKEIDEVSQADIYRAVDESEVTIKTVIDEQESVHDLEEITSTIMASESISSSEVLAIDKKLDGKLTENIPLNRFTDTPTRTGLPAVKSFVGRYLDETKGQAASSQQKLKEIFPTWSATVQETARTLMTSIASSLEGLRTEAQVFVSEPAKDSRYLVYVQEDKNGLINLRKASLNQYCSTNIKVNNPALIELGEVATKMSAAILPRASSVFRLSTFGKVNPDLGALENGGNLAGPEVNLLSIAALLAGPDVISQVDEIVNSMEVVTAEDSALDMARKMKDINNVVTAAVEMMAAIELISKYFAAVAKVRDSASI